MIESITATVRQDDANSLTVIVHDKDGNEIGSLAVDRVLTGVRVEGWNANDTLQGQLILHA